MRRHRDDEKWCRELICTAWKANFITSKERQEVWNAVYGGGNAAQRSRSFA